MRFILGLLFLLASNYSYSQLAIKNGVTIPSRDTLRVFVVFCEVDYAQGKCPSDLPDNLNGNWPKSENGKTLLPDDANTFFDNQLQEGQLPKGFITDYYHQASFGEYVLLGDYFPEVISIPCSEIRIRNNGLNQVLKELNKRQAKDTSLSTFNGYRLKDFDLWTPTPQGQVKIKKPDGKLDLVYLIWRNNRFIISANTFDNSGYGVNATRGVPFKNMKGVNNVTSFNSKRGGGKNAMTITIAEHLHGIFGGNHWHSAGGAGNHTFLLYPHSYGLTGQNTSTMQAVSGWDRWMMEWKSPEKKFVISANDEYGNELRTDSITYKTHPKGGIFVLRDHVATGDALRIKLPFIDWKKKGDPKNQYLWIENRRMNTRFDEYYHEDCANDGGSRFPKGTPGLYAYIQVGKDQKTGGSEIYTTRNEERNGLASPFMPLTAEGNYDFKFLYDEAQPKMGIDCNWNNSNIPIDKKRSLSNPFTGYSDLYLRPDDDFDGKLYSNEKLMAGLSERIGDTIIHNFSSSGDWEDAFCYATGNTRLSIATNPAPVPVYTFTLNESSNLFSTRKGEIAEYENRTIWLNGLSVEIIEEDNETGNITVRVSWDDYNMSNDVRWCGNLVLSPHVMDENLPSLDIWEKRKIHLDRGQSPQLRQALGQNDKGEWLFTEPTELIAKEGAFIKMQRKSKIIIDNNSTLRLMKGAKLLMEKKSKIILKNGGRLIIDEGAEVIKKRKAKVITKG